MQYTVAKPVQMKLLDLILAFSAREHDGRYVKTREQRAGGIDASLIQSPGQLAFVCPLCFRCVNP